MSEQPFSVSNRARHSLREFAPAAAALLLVGAAAQCGGGGEDSHSQDETLSVERPECPRNWGTRIPLYRRADDPRLPRGISRVGGQLIFTPPNQQLPAPGPITDIPEFHDCQKFPDSNGTGFAELFAIFATFGLDTAVVLHPVAWTSSNAAIATVSATGVVSGVAAGSATITGTVAGMVGQATLAVIVTPGASPGDTALTLFPGVALQASVRPGNTIAIAPAWGSPKPSYRAAATIYTYGPGYGPLGIGPDFSCLYLYFNNQGALQAEMVAVQDLAQYINACLDADPDTLNGRMLAVRRTAGEAAAAYPAVARWDWDEKHQRQYVGIRCGDGWCEVSDPEFVSSRNYSALATSGGMHVLRVKGWYDEQFLAVPVAGGGMRRSRLLGTVIPDPALATKLQSDFTDHWVPTSYVALEGPADDPDFAYYSKKLNFDAVSVTAPLEKMNQLSLCFRKGTQCEIPETVLSAAPPSCGEDKSMTGGRWWVKIVSASGRTVFKCIKRRDHSNFADLIPATARWRWILGDDTVWQACTMGCCEASRRREMSNEALAW